MKTILYTLIFALAAQPELAQQRPTFSLTTNVVIVNVSVLDRNGKPIENLTKDDFQIFEDGKLQKLQSVDLQKLQSDLLPELKVADAQAEPVKKGYNPDEERAAERKTLSRFQDRRLIVMLFDFSSMQPAEQVRAREAALQFIDRQFTSSDSVAIMTFGAELKTLLDFTSNRDLITATINRFRAGEFSENASVADAGADSQDESGQFVADETEFNIFNSDLKLAALEDAARKLAQYPEKKAILYFSSGIQKNGMDNQSQLRATVNTAVRSNVAFYPIDCRGLVALVPGGDATQAASAGTGLYTGATQVSARESFNNQQETLVTLAADTGGKALLDSNDLTEGMRQVQKDFTSYYVLSYVTENPALDGRYRKITVKLTPRAAALKAKLDYRQGYYAPTTFAKMSESDKDAQLQQALLADDPVTDLPIAVEADYFRLEKSKYFVPISVKVPGSALSFKGKGAKQATELDFIAEVFDQKNRPASTVRDTIPLKVSEDTAGQVAQKSILYDTGVTLTPGQYRLRVVARENGEGKVGTFEATLTVPDLATDKKLRASSIVLSNQRQAVSEQIGGVKNSKKLLAQNPLIQDGQELIPNVTRVFHAHETVQVYVEVYDPAVPAQMPENFRRADVMASVSLFQNDQKVFETQPVRSGRFSAGREATSPLWLQVPLGDLKPGKYICQVNLIDAVGRRFAFPRAALAILR